MTQNCKRRRAVVTAVLASILAAAALGASPAGAFSLFGKGHAKPAALPADSSTIVAAQVREAIDEKRYVDAADLMEKARIDGLKSPLLTCLGGEVLLVHGQFPEALEAFKGVDANPAVRAEALEGEGVALSMMGKIDESLADLKESVALDKTRWRAWNGLGRDYDMHEDWKLAEAAYKEALDGAGASGANDAIVLNNRGYSYLLQKKTDLATADFVDALAKDPTLGAARTNLRLTMAIQGHYDRAAIAGVGDDRAAVLNNVGLAAAIRGDYPEAEKLLQQAIAAKGSYYERASDNLQLAKELQERAEEHPGTPNANP